MDPSNTEIARIVRGSAEAAAEMGHSELDAEHILLYLLSEPGNDVVHVFESVGCPVERAGASVREVLPPPGAERTKAHGLRLTKRAERVFQNACLEVLRVPRNKEPDGSVLAEMQGAAPSIDPRDMLSALLRDAGDPLTEWFEREFGVTYELVRGAAGGG
ncbi:MAG: hypothetical protein JJ896_14525 [Rhodothermales bacterium]|nr:hypothetical protein [Rhodothermales bacterium]MBO6780866.1 hypothetical protein [Rhodothermales bacterium]